MAAKAWQQGQDSQNMTAKTARSGKPGQDSQNMRDRMRWQGQHNNTENKTSMTERTSWMRKPEQDS
jgi:hypothetical protein